MSKEFSYQNIIEQLDTNYTQISEISDQLQEQLKNLLDPTMKVPTSRMALAELISSYTQLKKTQTDVLKSISDTLQRQQKVELDKKLGEVPDDFLFRFQRILNSKAQEKLEEEA